MPTPTTELGLQVATNTDDQPTYLVTNLGASLTILDDLFNDTTGHNHGGPGEGGPVAITIADGSITAAMLEDPFTMPGIVTPTTFPPVGSWRLYPHADGQYFKIDSTGVELPIVAPGAIPDPLTIGTLIVTISATTPPLQQAEVATPATGLPPAGSRLLYPKADGYYYSVDDLGAELPVAAAGAAATPPVTLTSSRHQIGTTLIEDLLAALVTHGIIINNTVA